MDVDYSYMEMVPTHFKSLYFARGCGFEYNSLSNNKYGLHIEDSSILIIFV